MSKCGLKSSFVILSIVGAIVFLVGCSTPSAEEPGSVPATEASESTPAALPLPLSGSDIDENINQDTIDGYLNRNDVAYFETRMLYDPASFGEGTQSNLTQTLPGFKVVPYPYLGTIPIPLDGVYSGPNLYTIEWNGDGTIASAKPNYQESERILADLFPKDKALFIQCGAGAYAGFTKLLLVELGWDEKKIYNVGGNWSYSGSNAVDLTIPIPSDDPSRAFIASWRTDAAYIDFSQLHPIS